MAAHGITDMKLTRSSKKRILRDASTTSRTKRSRLIKIRRIFSPGGEDWYYTRGQPPTVVKNKETWMLSVGYYKRPEQKGTKSNLQFRARSIDARFSKCDNIPNTVASQQHAQLFSKQFRRHVETFIRGGKPKRRIDYNLMEDLNEASRVVARPIKAFKKVNAIKVSLLVAIKRRSD